jgi:PAP2 superfamily
MLFHFSPSSAADSARMGSRLRDRADDSSASMPPRRSNCVSAVPCSPGNSETASRPADNRIFHQTQIAISLFFVVTSAVGLWLTNIAVAPLSIAVRCLPALFVLPFFFYYRWRGEQKLQHVLAITFWSIVFSVLYSAPMYIVLRSPIEFQDQLLARMDRTLGIEVPAILLALESFPECKWFLHQCYDTLLIFITIAIIVPPFLGHMQRAKEYMVSGIAAALIAYPIFALLPALGPWAYYQYPGSAEQQAVDGVMVTLKGPEPYVLNYLQIEGLITFPSFHTVLAILAAYALWPIRLLRWPAVLLAGLISISTLTTGWHYLADVISGVLVALAACLVARGYSWCERRAGERHGR